MVNTGPPSMTVSGTCSLQTICSQDLRTVPVQLTHSWLLCECQLSQLLFQFCHVIVCSKVYKSGTGKYHALSPAEVRGHGKTPINYILIKLQHTHTHTHSTAYCSVNISQQCRVYVCAHKQHAALLDLYSA